MQPRRMGKYLLADLINQGGMADVFLAKSPGFGGADALVALKCIRPELTADEEFVRMFVEEAKLSVLLSHANIGRIYELGNADTTLFIAMEYVAGRNLRAVLDRARAEGLAIPEHLVLHIAAQVCEGLDYAHRKASPTGAPLRIVHRDVSPHNILISYQGDVKLIDFGIAKAANEASRTQSGVLKGKHGYMSPEQVTSGEIDARSDVFALGVVLWEMLTGARLFQGGSDFSVLEKVRNAEVVPPTFIAPQLPSGLDALVLHALAARPEERYASAGELHDAIVRVLLERHGPPSARELANLMASLFSWEIREDQRRADQARRLRPEDVDAPLPSAAPTTPAPLRGVATLADRPAAQPEATDATLHPFRDDDGATEPRGALLSWRGLRREALIVGAAAGVAVLLMLGAWLGAPALDEDGGALLVMTRPPRAMVRLDGRALGETPLSVEAVTPGLHTLLFDRPGFQSVVKHVEVRSGQIHDVSERLLAR